MITIRQVNSFDDKASKLIRDLTNAITGLSATNVQSALQNERLTVAVSTLTEALERITKPQPTIQGELIMFKVKTDNPDVEASFSDKVTDSEGNEITDPAVLDSLVKSFTSDNENAVAITGIGPYNVHFGNPGVAALSVSIAKPDGTVLGSGVFGVTVVVGDPAAVTDIKLKLGDLVDE